MEKTIAHPKTLQEAIKLFADQDAALRFMVALRWPDGVCCPRCGSVRVRFISTRRVWECREDHKSKRFSVKTGTIMEESPLPLDKWLVAIWLEANAKNSISSYEVHRALGITQKSAWFMQQRIRLALQSGSLTKLSGNVEVDESFIGGLSRNMHKDRRAKVITKSGPGNKTPVMGLLERTSDKKCSRVIACVVPNTKRDTLMPIIRSSVEPGAQVSTDSLHSYHGLKDDYIHGIVDHATEYVNGNVHTNGLENFWSLFKRCIKGTHVSVEPFHLFRYLDAECFRFNNREDNDGGRFNAAIKGINGKRLTYKSLTGCDPEGRYANGTGEADANLGN